MASLRWHQLAHSCPLAAALPGLLFKRIRLKKQRTADTPARGSYPQHICGILATENRCHHRTQRRPGQGTDRGGPRPDRLLPTRHHHHPPCPVRQTPLRLRGRPSRPARPLPPVDPHRPGQDRHPAAHPGPVPGLRTLVRQHPATPHAGRRTGKAVPDGNGQGRRLGHDHPRNAGTAPHQARSRPEPAHTTQNAGRSAPLTREPRPASDT